MRRLNLEAQAFIPIIETFRVVGFFPGDTRKKCRRRNPRCGCRGTMSRESRDAPTVIVKNFSF
jgi:hypothetical protein